MELISEPFGAHPNGEIPTCNTSWPIDTPGGRFQAEFDPDSPVTVHGQFAFFAQFLHAGQRWAPFIKDCPLEYRGNRGSGKLNVMGTAVLSILCGHWRYLHINAVRGDALNAHVFGMDRLVSDDVVRNAFNHHMDESKTLQWLHEYQRQCVVPLLSVGWICDIDSTIKPLYGNQEGAEVGYNPQKPGRPSHVYHSYFVANLRLCLGVEVLPGKSHAGKHGREGFWRILNALPRTHWPAFLRGDCGYSHDEFLTECEQVGLPFLMKLRFTRKVRDLVQLALYQGAQWKEDGHGWQVLESRIRLTGWKRARRVVILREAAAQAPTEVTTGAPPETTSATKRKRRRRGKDRDVFPVAEASSWESAAPWSGKLAVIVTSLDPQEFPAEMIGQQYRDRGSMENCYDELKNQWGWNGYTTQKLKPCRVVANLIVLIANWWSLYVRLFDEESHREAITSRRALLTGVAREVTHGGQRKLKVSILHEKGDLIEKAISLISKFLNELRSIAASWTPEQCWSLLLTRIFRRKLGGRWLENLPPEANLLLSG
jgi:Transposase DDE domain group 1